MGGQRRQSRAATSSPICSATDTPRLFTAKEQRSVAVRDTGSLHSLHGHIARPEVSPLGTVATDSQTASSINILPPDFTLSSNCFASNLDQTQCLPKLRYKCQHEAQQHKHYRAHPTRTRRIDLLLFPPPPCIYDILSSARGRKQQNTWSFCIIIIQIVTR